MVVYHVFADGDENGGEGPGEEQQGPQKPKKVLTLIIMCKLNNENMSGALIYTYYAKFKFNGIYRGGGGAKFVSGETTG